VGAAVCSARKKEPGPGALVGSLAAIGAAFLGFAIRRSLTQNSTGVPKFLIALAEDALTIGMAVAVLRMEADARIIAE
jgi:hypothetical protein